MRLRNLLAPLWVWGTWTLMLAAGLVFVGKYGSNVPYWDEWNMVTVLVGDQPVDAHWLWSEHNGHRIPLPRLFLLALYQLTGSDFCAGMYFNVFALGALAFAMIWAAKVQRGGTSYADAFFPLMLLHWGHYENLLWTWQVTQVVPVILACVLLLIIVRRGVQLMPRTARLAGICLALLPLCGMPGLVYVPALTLWLCSVGTLQWRSTKREGRRRGLVIFGFATAALFLTVLYLVNYREPARHLSSLDLRASLKTALQFLSGGFGPAAAWLWPYSGLGMLGLLPLTGGILLGVIWRHHAPERARALGLLLFMVAITCLALSVGLGRRGYGFTPRYFLQAVPALCCVYYAWGVCGLPTVGRLIQIGLLVLIGSMSLYNFREGLHYGRVYHDKMEAFQRDLLAGEPISKLLARHAPSLCPCPFGGEPTWGVVVDEGDDARAGLKFPPVMDCVSFHDWLGDRLQGLQRARIGYFRSLQPERLVFRELPLSVTPTAQDPTREGGRIRQETPGDSTLTWALREPPFVYGIRVTYDRDLHPAREDGRPPCLQVFWKRSDQPKFTGSQRYIHYWGPGESRETIWVYDTIDQLAINLDNDPDALALINVVLLVPTPKR